MEVNHAWVPKHVFVFCCILGKVPKSVGNNNRHTEDSIKNLYFTQPYIPKIQEKQLEFAFIGNIWGGGGIGRRCGLKIRRWRHRVGSTPPRPTDSLFRYILAKYPIYGGHSARLFFRESSVCRISSKHTQDFFIQYTTEIHFMFGDLSLGVIPLANQRHNF